MRARDVSNSWQGRLLLGGVVSVAFAGAWACSRDDGADRPTAKDDRKSKPAVVDAGEMAVKPSIAERATPADVGKFQDRKPRPRSNPLSDDDIAAARARIAQADDYRDRIEARRALIYPLCGAGQIETAMTEIDALLDDVEAEEGRNMAERVALSNADTLRTRERHAAAIPAYGRLLLRWPDSRFAAEALYHSGACHLEEREYAEAAQVFQRLIEEYDESPQAGWGWRKLALAQLLQGAFDASLATLDVMAKKYTDTPFGEYARMRRGYVQMAAGRVSEARSTYKSFLAECSGSKYCRLVEKQIRELDRFVLARAGE